MRKVWPIFLLPLVFAACAPQTAPSPTQDEHIPATQHAQAIFQSTTSAPLPTLGETSDRPPAASPTPLPEPTATLPTPTPTVPALLCQDTNAMAGTTLTCCIQHAYCSFRPDIKGRPTFCNDAPYPGHHFTLLVWGQDWSDYDGKCLDVTGLVSRYRGKPEIIAEDKSQVSPCP